MRLSPFALATLLFLSASAMLYAQQKPGFDGPAELPRVYVNSDLADTPAPGKSIVLKSGDNLQAAINEAACGDTIRLAAGSEFTGGFHFPAKSCDDTHWIVIRTDAPDSALPPEGQRLTPCYAGVSSLPGRPAYPCSNAKNILAKITYAGNGSGPIRFSDGANHYRFIGLEIARAPGQTIFNLAMIEPKGTANHLVFDRVWMHGTPQDETTRGIALGGSTYLAVVDSYFSDFHCIAMTGACVDAQAVSGGVGDRPMGPYKIVDNFMEGAAETVIFGGGEATMTPTDIEIRRNHFFKPLSWMPGNPNFVGGANGRPFIVKNLFELKNAQRVLFEGNVLDNTWGGFSQPGYAILLTPKNQGGHCAACRISDVIVRYNLIRHAASGITIGTGLSDAGAAASGGERYSIHDNVFEDLNGTAYKGFGVFAQITSTVPALKDVVLDHNTAFPPRALFVMGVPQNREKIQNLVFTNNLVSAGDQQIEGTGGGPGNCSFQPARQGPEGVLKNCTVGLTFTHNAIVNAGGGWPKGNFTFKDKSAAAVSEDGLTLCQAQGPGCKKASSLLNAATDSRAVGADMEKVNAATAGVE